MRIVLSYESEVPIYEQVKEQIKTAILSGALTEGDALPSIRQLARDLKVSVMTTTRAYGDLELEGFIHTLPKKGCYVKKVNENLILDQYNDKVVTALKTAVTYGKIAGLTMDDLHKKLDSLEVSNHE